MEQSALLPRPTIEQLRHVANNFPLIDNHAHNLILSKFADTIPFETISTEAQGRALRDTFKSLSHLRAAKQLRQLYECGEDADWEDILEQRVEWLRTDPERLHQRCFEGVHALLIDDGLAGADKVHSYTYHDKFTKAPTKRIIRIETVAESLMEGIIRDAVEDDVIRPKFMTDTWLSFTEDFERLIMEAIGDDDVAGFKSVICYRSGLDIEPDYELAARAVGLPFEKYVKSCIRKRKYRIERKALNDYLVLRTLEILSEGASSDVLSKPLQLHTGLGDNDINLLESNPAFLQPLIENYPGVPFVLLHSAYPYTREAGYLASVYRHVFLDVGEVFPMVSRDGQTAILRQAMELVPGSKLLYSSDGHWFPETFWLANLQFREVWLDVLTDYVEKGDLTPFQAIAMTKDILFNNSNHLYNLRYEAVFDETIPESQKQLTYRPKSGTTSPYQAPPGSPPGHATRSAAAVEPATARSPSPYSAPSFPPPPKVPQVYNTALFDKFMEENPGIKFVYVQWLDYMATFRARVVPIKEFTRMIREGDRIGISQGNTGTLQNDTLTPLVNTTGQIYIEPDLRSLSKSHKKDPLVAATVLSYWRDEHGNPAPECPRHNLESLINTLQYTHSTTLLIGFEIEVVFLARKPANPFSPTSPILHSHSHDDPYTPLTQTHAWGTLNPEQWLQLPFLGEILTSLEDMGIDVQQLHAESGPGQYEFILPPQPPMLAIDTLLQTRQTIAQIAAQHNLRATLHPSPFSGVGTGAHAHISLDPCPTGSGKDEKFFVAGVLAHLPAICAFSLPMEESYARVKDGAWTGGSWVAWGTQNRETPLRRVKEGHWEVRAADGLANPYFLGAAIVAAGLLGLEGAGTGSAAGPGHEVNGPTQSDHQQQQAHPPMGSGSSPPPPSGPPAQQSPPQQSSRALELDVPYPPSTLPESQRASYNITRRLPKNFTEALEALQADTALGEKMGERFVHDYLVMKKSERDMMAKMGAVGEGERRNWVIERY